MFAHGYNYGEPPPYGAGMPPPPFPPPMPPGGPGYGPPPGMMPPGMMPPEMMPPPGFGDPVGFLLPSLFKAVGGLFSRPALPPLPLPPLPSAESQPLPGLFYRDRPQFCQLYCPPVPGGPMPGMPVPGMPYPGMAQPGGRRHRRRHRRGSSRLGEPVGALPLLAALAPLAASVLPGLIQRLTGGGRSNLSGYGYYGEPPPPGYAGW